MTKRKKPEDLEKVGRKPFFETPEQLQIQIDKYFESTDQYTLTGLALYVGFASRYSIYDYEEKPEFSHTIKRARLRIENRIETLLLYGKQNQDFNLSGGMLWLKTNAGYTDRMVDKGANKDFADVNVPQRQSREEWEKENE